MELTPLCELGFKHRTDKCPQLFHTYTPFYYNLLKERKDSIKKVLELGIGTLTTMKHISDYNPGASHRMWRDFFPNAQIYGADIDPNVIFQEDRITTFLVDTTKEEDLKELIKKTGSDIDLVIDDGPHNALYQMQTARTLMPLLDKNVTYIIEDVRSTRYIRDRMKEYNVEIIRLERSVSKDNNLVIIRHK